MVWREGGDVAGGAVGQDEGEGEVRWGRARGAGARMETWGRAHGEGQFFFVKDTATTEIYTLSLQDALPIGNADAIS